MSEARVSWIAYTPVKGLRLQTVDDVELTEIGIPGDRRFHLINDQGHLTNAKRVGQLQQVVASWDEQGGRLGLHFPDGRVVEDQVRTNGETITTSFYGRPVEGVLVDGEFSDALSSFTGTRLRLVEPLDPGVGIDRGAEGSITLLSEESLHRLAQEAGVDEVDSRRFRMNFGIAGVEPNAEDDWIGRSVQLGDAVVVPRGHVGRCLITSRDPESGEIDLDTLDTLANYRLQIGTTEELALGVFGHVERGGPVRVGDPVTLCA